jgi:tripartite ATP-independent transporter DctM subunit
MDPGHFATLVLLVLLFMLGSGLWIAVALLGTGLFVFFAGTTSPAGSIMATTIWGSSASWTLTALPVFIWMGEILFRSRLSDEMFRGLAPWLGWLPGRLLHVNVVGCGIFAAACGSSAATMATIGRISLPELARRGYPAQLSMGALTSAGTLGIMIPPSITFIVYGVSAEVSIARLFAAGIVPGLVLMALFMGYLMFWALTHADKMPPAEPRTPFIEKLRSSRHLIPVVLLIALVIGSIYTGIATPTESAALGVAGALILSAVSGTLTWTSFVESIREAVRTSCMIAFIIMGSMFLSAAVDFTGLPHAIAKFIESFSLSAYGLLFALTILFAILGCFLDGVSIVVLASSLLLPTVQAAGIDLIWFGVFMVLMVEMSMVTPPVGLNLFIMQMMSGRDLGFVSRAALPFFVIMVGFVALLVAVPQMATYLPQVLFRTP